MQYFYQHFRTLFPCMSPFPAIYGIPVMRTSQHATVVFFLGKYLVTTLRITSWKLLTKLSEKQPGQSVIFDDLLDFEVLESVK